MNKNDEIDPQPPPIPPRRKKRKNNLSAVVASEPTSKPSSQPIRKLRLPPPPPPPVQQSCEKRNQFMNNPQHKKPEYDIENNSPAETKSIPQEVKFNTGEESRILEVRPNFQNQDRFKNQNKYPPLLFTFQDFQTVMGESISNRDYQTSVDETFSSNNLIDESKVCFRVTTTDLPFEKCLGTWQNSFDNPEFAASDESSFIFEDYINRNNRTGRPDLFRMESLENSAEDLVTNSKKVKFVIESPSTSTPNEDTEITMDSLQNLESLNKDLEDLLKIQSDCEAIQHSEEDLFDSLCDSDDLNLVEVVSETDLIYKNIVENKETEDKTFDFPKLDIERSSHEVISAHVEDTTEIEAKILASPKLQKNKTCMSSDHFKSDIPEPEKHLEEPKETSHYSKMQRFKTQQSGSGCYEDAFDSEELILIGDKISDLDSSQNLDNQNISIENQDVKASEESSKKKIFIDSSLCDFINEDNDISWNESSDEEEGASSVNLESEIKIDPSPQVSSIPVSISRNSFLDKMLNEEACEVIATHLKADDSKPEKGIETSVEVEISPHKVPILSTSSEKRVMQKSSKFDESKNEVPKGKIVEEGKMSKKSFGEAKCDVLNELLCNFSAIKLKSIASNKMVDRDPSANHIKLPDKSVCEQKTDKLRFEKDGSTSARVTDPSETLLSVENQLINVDKCAIARRGPEMSNYSFDNNAKTPVALSNDQSHEAFSITPGRVRNFIKHYEIQQETSNQCFKDKNSKDKDVKTKDVKAEAVKDKYVKATDDKAKDVKVKESNTKDRNRDLSTKAERIEILKLEEKADQDSLINLTNLIEDDSFGHSKTLDFIGNSKQEFESACQSLTPNGPKGRRQSCIKSNDSSPTSERKKSVQFDSACTVIQLQKQEESSMTSLINGIRCRIKGKAPNKPEMQMPITFKTSLRSDDSTPDIQIESIAQSTGNTSKSGTDHLVPKTDTPQQNETFVFYCKV